MKSCGDQTTPYRSIGSNDSLRHAMSKGGVPMDEKIISVTEKAIGDTLYIIESAVSNTTKETAYEKLKRMILNDTTSLEIEKAS